MLFNSLSFAIFLLVTFVAYYLPFVRKSGWQLPLLVLASFVFYSWESPILLTLLLISILLNAFTSWKVAYAPVQQRRMWALLGVVINLTILGFFKYATLLGKFLIGLTDAGADSALRNLLLIPLPIGISFYTFEGISLLVDSWKSAEKDPPEKQIAHKSFWQHLVNTSLFVAFFPHLVSGPILKANHFLPQICEKLFKDIPWERAVRAMIVGFFLKLVIADNIKDYTWWIAFPYYEVVSFKTGLILILAYSVQIFTDFAGYSLIAIGLAWMFGYELIQNFNFPYISQSISEFWRRWHISLSTWLRDYLYFPLGGNRKGKFRTYVNLMIVMGLGGLWHGAAISYIIWGLYHGIGLAIERMFADLLEPLWKRYKLEGALGWWVALAKGLFVFTFVSFGWLLFKLTTSTQAIEFVIAMWRNRAMPLDMSVAAPVILLSIPPFIYHLLATPRGMALRKSWSEKSPARYRRLEACAFGILLYFIFANAGSSDAFIYFQF